MTINPLTEDEIQARQLIQGEAEVAFVKAIQPYAAMWVAGADPGRPLHIAIAEQVGAQVFATMLQMLAALCPDVDADELIERMQEFGSCGDATFEEPAFMREALRAARANAEIAVSEGGIAPMFSASESNRGDIR